MLKEHCHWEFCCFWFNSAKITAFCLLSCKKKCSYRISKMNSNEILAGRANYNNFVGHLSMHRVKFWKKLAIFFQISILFHPCHLWWHTRVYNVSTILQSSAAKPDHYFKVSTDALAVLSFLKWWDNSVTVPLQTVSKQHTDLSFEIFSKFGPQTGKVGRIERWIRAPGATTQLKAV